MPEYKEQTLSGKQWTRGCRVIIDNPRNMTPTISVFEEKVFLTQEGQEVISPCGSFANNFNPDEVFQMYNASTNEEIEGASFTGKDLYNLIYSYYMNMAHRRDESLK